MATPKELLVNLINDNMVINMIEQYKTKSYMEFLGDSRSETAHSSFLRSLILSDSLFFDKKESPLMRLLLSIVVADNSNLIPTSLTQQVISGSLNYKIKEVTCEKPVSDVGKVFFSNSYPKAIPTDDRLDLYISCDVKDANGKKTNELEIILENKILSSEEGPKSKNVLNGYDNLWQTERYYKACNDLNKQQIFVYLTPDNRPNCTDTHFIHITYQCLLDNMLAPLSENIDVNNQTHFMIADYIKALDIPTLDTDSSKRIVLARSKTEVKRLNALIRAHEELLWQFVIAKVKHDNMPLTSDEKMLLCYVETNPIFGKMISDYTDKDIDITDMRMKVDADWIVSFTRSRTLLFKKSWLKASQGLTSCPIAYIKIPSTQKIIKGIPTRFYVEIACGAGTNNTQVLSSQLLSSLPNYVSNNPSTGNAHYYQYTSAFSNPIASASLLENLKSIISDNVIQKYIQIISQILK